MCSLRRRDRKREVNNLPSVYRRCVAPSRPGTPGRSPLPACDNSTNSCVRNAQRFHSSNRAARSHTKDQSHPYQREDYLPGLTVSPPTYWRRDGAHNPMDRRSTPSAERRYPSSPPSQPQSVLSAQQHSTTMRSFPIPRRCSPS